MEKEVEDYLRELSRGIVGDNYSNKFILIKF